MFLSSIETISQIQMRERSYKVNKTNFTIKLFNIKQPRELDFMGITVFTGFFSESRRKKVKELFVKVCMAKKKMKDSRDLPR